MSENHKTDNCSPELKEAIDNWLYYHKTVIDMINHLNDKDALGTKLPREGLNTYTKHFEEMVSIEICYVKSLQTKVLDFSNTPSINGFTGQTTTDDLLTQFDETDKEFIKELNKCNQSQQIDFSGIKYSLSALVYTLIAHEMFHCGQIAAFCYVLQIPIPKSWQEFWAMPE